MAERILITGARAAAALDLARDFRAAGYEVHAADCSPARISRWSRAVTRFHGFASPVREPDAFARDLAAILDEVQPILVVPTCEEVFHLAMPPLAARIGERLFAPPLSTLAALHDKGRFAARCAELDLPVPETHRLTSAAEVQPFLAAAEDWVFKSCFSRFGQATMVGPEEASLRRLAPSPEAPWIAQRRIRGREISFYAVAHRGALAAFAAYGADWRLSGGASISFDPLDPDLGTRARRLAEAIAEDFDITGQFACDLMVDLDGAPWLIECNPRATSGVHLLTGEGRLARAILGQSRGAVVAAPNSRHLLPAMLTYGLAEACARRGMGAWMAQLRRGCDVAGAPGDRRPMAGALLDGLGFMLAGRARGTSAAAASTADIEWNGKGAV